jgi:hypothetical protein
MNRPTLRTIARWGTGLLVVIHGLIHLLGTVEGFGWVDVEQMTEETSTAVGVAWLVAAVVTVAAGAMLLARVHRWWWLGAAAIVLSQLLIFGAWNDAKVGTVANVVLFVAVVHAYASQGARSARSHFRDQASSALAVPASDRIVTEADLAHLPAPVAEYLRRAGSVGQRRVGSFHAHIHGRIRSGSDKPWMTFVGEQVNTYGERPGRLFFMDATMLGLPVDVLHEFVDDAATMRVKVCSLFTMVDASGPDLTRAETVTVFNDMCILAPAALVDAPVTWTAIDRRHVSGTYSLGVHTVSAVLVFDDDGDLIDFVSQDRLAASADGRTFTPQPWSTPVKGYVDVGARRVATFGEGRWHPDDGAFTYLEFNLDDISYDTSALERQRPVGSAAT